MSKKKAFSTMTLKDFHGGSIPSDLPLPSAPGMTIERSGHDRQNAGAWMGPPLNRGFGGDRGGFLRQGSANGARTFEDKALYFPNPANIGRNYDEDERKPVDGHIRRGQGVDSCEDQMYEQRRTGYDRPSDRYSADNRGNYHSSSAYSDSRTDNYVHEEFGLIPVGPPPPKPQSHDYQQQPQASPTYLQDVLPPRSPGPQEPMGYYQSQQMRSGPQYGSQQHQDSVSPPRAWRPNAGSGQQPVASGAALGTGSGVQNVWTARREGEMSRSYSAELAASDTPGPWRAEAAASRIAQASAVEKVSSGRWHLRVSTPTLEQPLEHVGQYTQTQGHSYDGGRVVTNSTEPAPLSEHDIGQARYPSDLGQGVYNENMRNSYIEYGRSAYTESGRGLHPESARVSYSDMGQGTFPDSSREQYREVGGRKTLADPNRDLVDGGTRYLESGRGSLSDPAVDRYVDDSSGHGYGEIGWRMSTGHRDSPRPVGSEGGTYVEPARTLGNRDLARLGGNEAVTYAEPGHLSQSSFGWSRSVVPGRGEYIEGGVGIYGDASRGAVHEPGRRGFSNADQRVEVDSGLVTSRIDTSPGRYRSDSRRGTYSEGGHNAYVYEGGQEPHAYVSGRDSYPSEALKSPYLSDAPKGAYANDRSRGTYTTAFDHGLPLEGGRSQTPRGARNSTVGESGQANILSSSSSLDSEGKNIPSERPKLKLLPRSKPLEVEPADASLQEASRDVQQDSEGGQSNSSLPSELHSTGAPVTAALNSSVGSGSAENEEETNRPSARPKLNLKPRSQPADVVPDSGSMKERKSVFGGARPRELVLKDRGVDDSLIVGVDHVPTPGGPLSGRRPTSGGNQINGGEVEYQGGQRAEKQDKVEEKLDGRRLEQHDGGNNRHVERQDSGRLERYDSRGRKEGWFDQDRKEDRRGTERIEYRHIQEKREPERQDVDKQDSWRRPVETSSSSFGPRSPNPGSGMADLSSRMPGRLGSSSSAAELAQAFSRSTSIGSSTGGPARGYPSQRSPMPRSPGHGFGMGYEASGPYGASPKEAPFSRLTEAPSPGPRDVYASGVPGGYRRTNGY